MPRFVVEHKHSSEDISPGAVYWRRLLIDAQIDFYLPGAETLGVQVDGVLYDVLGKPLIRPKLATPIDKRKYAQKTGKLHANQRDADEPPEEFEKRCLDKIGEDPDKYYQRRTIIRLEKEREEAAKDVWATAVSIRDARRLKVFPRNPDSCVQWGRACSYFDVCTSVSSIDDEFLFRTEEFENSELGAAGEGLLTQSSIRCYRSCPRRYYYRYVRRARPLMDDAAPLRIGTMFHKALEVWWRTGGDALAALATLDVAENKYERAKMRAMIIGYHARWDKPPPTEFVELFIETPLVNPETGGVSRSFRLGMKLDCLADLDEDLTVPTGDPQSLEGALEASIREVEEQ
jgi:hypothetical protein